MGGISEGGVGIGPDERMWEGGNQLAEVEDDFQSSMEIDCKNESENKNGSTWGIHLSLLVAEPPWRAAT